MQTAATQKADSNVLPVGYTMGAAWGPVPETAPEVYTIGASWGPVRQASEESSYGFETTSTNMRAVTWQSKKTDHIKPSSGHLRDDAKRSIAPATKPVVELAAIETFGIDLSVNNSRKRRHDQEWRENDSHVGKFVRDTFQNAKRQKIMDELEEKRRRVTSWLKEEFQGLKKQSSFRKAPGAHRHTPASSAKSTTAGLSWKTNRKSSTRSSDQVLKKKAWGTAS